MKAKENASEGFVLFGVFSFKKCATVCATEKKKINKLNICKKTKNLKSDES